MATYNELTHDLIWHSSAHMDNMQHMCINGCMMHAYVFFVLKLE